MIPAHLKRYVVEQNYDQYTSEDQAVWRYTLRRLKNYLAVHAHPCYLNGLKNTAIEEDQIPRIPEMSARLEQFGWRAVAVSGFIPPAAFMEMQSLGILPIACDMRSIQHLNYTPAPDIVHEAAGHAPILTDPAFANYLKQYAQVAKHAIIGRRDLEQYECIRILSDLKEHPDSTPDQIMAAEKKLEEVNRSLTLISEAALLGRMNWWTAEYGLIGSLKDPKIFGAGLLSSVGESQSCLSSKVKKIPLTVDCIRYSYDITEPQPQLFVTPDFDTLGLVLEELADQMAYRRGGVESLHKAWQAETVNTVELNSGLQISGVLKNYVLDDQKNAKDVIHPDNSLTVAYLQYEGPTLLAENGSQLLGQGVARHRHGFGTPVGFIKGLRKCASLWTESERTQMGLIQNANVTLHFESGLIVDGEFTGLMRSSTGKNLVWTFKNCRVTFGDRLLFDPAWGEFDMGVGSTVPKVYSGPADRIAFGETEDFAKKTVSARKLSPMIEHKHRLYSAVRKHREQNQIEGLESILTELEENFPDEWLMRLEIFEICKNLGRSPSWLARVELELKNLSEKYPSDREAIENGLRILNAN